MRWKYFSSFSSVAMGNSNVWEWFKHLENMLYIIYLDNEEHRNNLNFMVKHILCLEQKNSWIWGLRDLKQFCWNVVINGLCSLGIKIEIKLLLLPQNNVIKCPLWEVQGQPSSLLVSTYHLLEFFSRSVNKNTVLHVVIYRLLFQ